MYHLISNQVKTDDFTSSFNVQSGALNQVWHCACANADALFQPTGQDVIKCSTLPHYVCTQSRLPPEQDTCDRCCATRPL